MYSLKLLNEVALVTGSSRGIGKAIAMRLAKEGAHVIINASKSIKEAEVTLSELPVKAGQKHYFIKSDMAKPKQVSQMMKKINEEYGYLNILVNNAGTTRFIKHNQLKRLTTKIFDEIYKIHLRGSFISTQQALPMLKRAKQANIINIASIAAMTAIGSNIAYCAIKAGLVNMTMSLARALAPDIRVNAISPALTDTELIKGWKEYKTEQISKTPLRRLATCEDIADTVFALVSSLTYITGQNINVDGGRTLG
jgi:3-oxoacyl-[acyl-carrier protein] reductase